MFQLSVFLTPNLPTLLSLTFLPLKTQTILTWLFHLVLPDKIDILRIIITSLSLSWWFTLIFWWCSFDKQFFMYVDEFLFYLDRRVLRQCYRFFWGLFHLSCNITQPGRYSRLFKRKKNVFGLFLKSHLKFELMLFFELKVKMREIDNEKN